VIGVGGSGAASNGINLNAISTIGKNAAKGTFPENFFKLYLDKVISLFSIHQCYTILYSGYFLSQLCIKPKGL
jgi:hypothetical protein